MVVGIDKENYGFWNFHTSLKQDFAENNNLNTSILL